MKRHYCDIEGCKNEAYNLEVQVCTGYKQSIESPGMPKIEYIPFEVPIISTKDLCNMHFERWCKATYRCFYGKVKEDK